MLSTLLYPTLPYPTLTPNPTPSPLNPAPHHNPTPTPYTFTYPTLPPPHSTPTLLLSCHTPPNHALPYPTLPFRCICRSVQMFRYFCCLFRLISVWSFRSVPFRFGPLCTKQSVQTGWTRSSPSIACQYHLNFTIVDLTNVELYNVRVCLPFDISLTVRWY